MKDTRVAGDGMSLSVGECCIYPPNNIITPFNPTPPHPTLRCQDAIIVNILGMIMSLFIYYRSLFSFV